ncbi:MAG: Holliday junction resolvase RuvX [Candidatus Cloacimonetes bacterium]|nr:Holliday junction resolvase RuvX [Candidatus Cloacimonadota bacterium]
MAIYRLLAIDYGEVRVGIALSDPLRIISKPYIVLSNNENLLEEIQKIIRKESVGKIILGLPLNLQGEDSKKTIEVREFKQTLADFIDIPIEFYDERYTTSEATDVLKKMGYDSKQRRKVIDMMAASIILKSYMDDTK